MLEFLESAPLDVPGSRAGIRRGALQYPRLFMKNAFRYLTSFVMFAAAFILYDYMSRQPTPKYVPQKAHQMASTVSLGK
jgi:hypothetical protein